MKRQIIALSLLTALAAFSCAKVVPEETGGIDGNGTPAAGKVRLTLGTSGDGLKATLNGMEVRWQEGDVISVNGEDCPVGFDGNIAYVDVTMADSYEAIFPAEAYRNGKLLVQPSQYYVAGSFGSKANYMYASAESATLNFSNLCGVLKLTVSGSGTVASVSVRDNDGGSLCGSYVASGGVLETSGDVQYDLVTLNCKTESNSGVALTAGGTDFHIVMPARSYSKGLTITVELVNGHSMVLNSATPRTIVAGEILSTPVIAFSYPAEQIYSYHFDNLVWGGDPVGGKNGFIPDEEKTTEWFGYCNAVTDSNDEPGSDNITSTSTSNGVFELGKPYAYSRNIQSFKKVYMAREFHGYLGLGTDGSKKASFKFPTLSNMGSGICKAEYSWKMAFKNGHVPALGIQLLHTTSTPGKVLELRVDGVNITPAYSDPRWVSGLSDGQPLLKDASWTQERILVKAEDFGDFQWHEVKLVLGAVTKETVLEFAPLSQDTDQPFFVDEVSARRIDYENGVSAFEQKEPTTGTYSWDKSAFALQPSVLISPSSSTAMDALSNMAKPYGIKYIDLSISASLLFNTLKVSDLSDAGWAYADQKIAEYKQSLDKMGVKVWSIHLPYTGYKEGYVEDENSFDFCNVDEKTRAAVVNRSKVIMKHMAPLCAKYLMFHSTQHSSTEFNGRAIDWSSLSLKYYKDCAVKSYKELVAYAASADCKGTDGSQPVFTIENIANSGSSAASIGASTANLKYFCEQCPGLGLCIDTSHAIVNGINNLTDMIGTLAPYIKHYHIHGNNSGNDKDIHLMPGYKNGLAKYPPYNMDDNIKWGGVYDAIIKSGYRGAFTYETSSPLYGCDFRDCITNFNNIWHNYYGFILQEYQNL